ncbi:hypothetical protein NONO_c17500 [Nocardia nova SH22a]|uniref:Transcription regulator BetR N-terminal domain-containing protein n=2 Tax=Nocardia nova TaxID=37330 RepID=W5TB14_9NOCA|nr:hypothetical protein NONO_c17500 [Nocardia nova SH22a]
MRDADLNGRAVSSLIGMPYSTWRRKINGHASFSAAELHRLGKLFKSKASILMAAAEADAA